MLLQKMGSKRQADRAVHPDGCSQSMAERAYSIDLAGMDFSSDADGINYKEDSAAARLKDL